MIGDDIGVFLAIARSLGRAGIDVDVATCGEDYPGLASRFIKACHVLPPYLFEPEAWLDGLVGLVEREDYALILPSSDSSLQLLAVAAQRIAPSRLAIPNRAALDVFSDKAATRKLAASLGIATAEGVECVADPEVLHALAGKSFPHILKPSQPYVTGSTDAKTGVRMARTQDELEGALAAFSGRRIVAEAFFAGDGVGVSVVARDGAIEHVWQHRRLAAINDTGRSSRRMGERPDERLLRDVDKLARATALHGVAMFEFRQNVGSGDHILVEVNPRFWGSLPLAIASGADFPLHVWNMLTHAAPPATGPSIDTSIQKADLSAEYDRISSQWTHGPKRPANAVSLISLLAQATFRPQRFDGWAKDDPRPHWAELRQTVSHLKDTVTRLVSLRD